MEDVVSAELVVYVVDFSPRYYPLDLILLVIYARKESSITLLGKIGEYWPIYDADGTVNGRHRAHNPPHIASSCAPRACTVSIFKKNMRARAVFKFGSYIFLRDVV